MFRNLHALLKREKDDITEWLVGYLEECPAPHYREVDRPALEQRIRKLVGALVESARNKHLNSTIPGPFVHYVEQLAEARISEGYDLEEIQLALSKLEEKVWELVVTYRVPNEQAKQLRQLKRIIGAAKDHLARVYLSQMKRVWATASEL